MRPSESAALQALLDGTAVLKTVTIEGQSRQMIISNERDLREIERGIRKARRDMPILGTTFEADFELQSAGGVRTALYVPARGSAVTIAFPIRSLQDPIYYFVDFESGVPTWLTGLRQE
jgi:hypothetical protein